MSARDDYPKLANIVRGGNGQSEIDAALDEIDRLRAKNAELQEFYDIESAGGPP